MPSTVGRDPGKDAQRRVKAATEDALQKIGSDLLARAIPRTPMEEGTLRGSGHVEPETGARLSDEGGLEVLVIFDTPYAQAQHEGQAVMHGKGPDGELRSWNWTAENYTTPGTGSKFLEGPLKEMSGRYQAAIAAAIERELGLGNAR